MKVLRVPDVVERTGLSRTTIWRRVRAGKFPAPVVLGTTVLGVQTIGWVESEIDDWIAALPRRTYEENSGAG